MIFWLFENPDVLRQYMFCMALPCMLSTEFTSKSCMMLGFQNEGRLRRERGPAGDPQLRKREALLSKTYEPVKVLD